ncbi:unnamed protein product [Adineta steineri]|uniref:G-protein coupled receptors family 1 profile domain-containing protein n=1 Tax=Adineta steineri TaxID=433720 RepID=A0A814SKM7_9BILA|nr:unnamed protein product [Adineta steineri]
MSSNVTDLAKQISGIITTDIGLFILTTGLLGNILNIIVFLSLKTFRETSCAFYLTSASFANIIQLVATLFSRILITGYNIDLTQTSLFLCKLRPYVATIAPLMSISSMCFATIDQFTSLSVRWRHFNQRYIAAYLTIITLIFWCLVNIPVIIYNNITMASTNPVTWACSITNANYSLYYNRFYISFLLGFLQLIIRIIFELMAFITVRSLRNNQVPIIRLERDKQITSMVLIQTLVDVIISLPFFIYITYRSYTTIKDANDYFVFLVVLSTTNILYYATFSLGFYIYFCSSSRFRKQIIYVLVGIHLKYCCRINVQERNNNNQIIPQLTTNKPALSMNNIHTAQ